MYVPRHLRADALWKSMKTGKKETHLLLTGGGSLGGFQAGQLVSLLLGAKATSLLTPERAEAYLSGEDEALDILKVMPKAWFKIASISGVSAGACNLAILGSSLAKGQEKVNRLDAAAHLILFWLQDVPSMPSQLFHGRFHAMSKMPTSMRGWLDYMDLFTKAVPAEINPIIQAVEKHANFNLIRESNLPLYVAVTDISADKPVILTNQNLEARMIAASGAIDEWGMQSVEGLGEGAYHHNPFMHFLADEDERSDEDPDCVLMLRLDHNLVGSKSRSQEARQAASMVKTFHAPIKRDIERIRRKNKKEGRVIRLFESGLKRSYRFKPEDKANTDQAFLVQAFVAGLQEGLGLLAGNFKKRI